jgi:glycosyltransferase involved in cell wall biosynthesis
MLLFTSRYEGFPNVLAEAMAHGVPVVSTDCPTGPFELISHGENGYIVPNLDYEAAAEYSLKLLESPETRERFGDSARSVSERFSAEHVGDLWASLIERAMNERRREGLRGKTRD